MPTIEEVRNFVNDYDTSDGVRLDELTKGIMIFFRQHIQAPNEPSQCTTEPSTLPELFDAMDVIGKQLQSPFLREGYERFMKEAIEAGREKEQADFIPETVDEVVKRILDALAKTV